MLNIIFSAQLWIGPSMLFSLAFAAMIAFRRRPAAWSMLFLISATSILIALYTSDFAINTFGTQTQMSNGSVQIHPHATLHYVSEFAQFVGAVCGIAGAALTLRLKSKPVEDSNASTGALS